ncbi:hypothetical protein ABZ746_35135 [Streptomyces sp. NPDC020096]
MCVLGLSPAALAADVPWPQSPKDVRSVHRGDHITAIASDGEAHIGDTITSTAFTSRLTLTQGKGAMPVVATVRCNIKPGTYPVYLHSAPMEGYVWAQVKVLPDGASPPKGCAHLADTNKGTSANTAAIGGGAAAGVVAAGAGYYLLQRRKTTATKP